MKHCMALVTNAVIMTASCMCLRGSKTTAYLATSARLGIKRASEYYMGDASRASSIRAQSVSSVEKDGLSASQPPLLPPEDETCTSPIAAIRELLAAPALPDGTARYDEISLKTGGIWRTKRYGMVPCTVSLTSRTE